MTPGDVTEKRFMVTWLQEPYPVRCVPTGRQVSGGAQSGSKGEGPSLSGGGAHQTLFHFPERGLRESGTAVWAHYPRADSGLLGRCDTDVTVTARGTEFDWMRRNLLWCILGTQSRARGRARSVQAPPARSLAPRAPLYAFLGGERRRPPPSTPTQALPLLANQDRRHPTNSSPIPLSNRTATAPGTPGASMAPAPCGTGNTRGKKDPGPCSPTCPSRTGAQGSREYNTYPGPKPPNDGQSAMGPYGSGTASHAKGTTHTTPQVHSPGRRRKALCQAQALAGKEPSDHAQS